MVKIEIKSIFGRVLFTYENENATIKEAVLKAISIDANLRNADLRNADLSDADLSDANLRNADLRNANLRNANLRNADLSDANLRNANLRNADLSDANLSGAKNIESAYLPMFCKWSNSIIGDKIQIGCKTKTIEEWDLFFESDEEYSTKRNTPEFKQIQAIFEANKAYLTFLKN